MMITEAAHGFLTGPQVRSVALIGRLVNQRVRQWHILRRANSLLVIVALSVVSTGCATEVNCGNVGCGPQFHLTLRIPHVAGDSLHVTTCLADRCCDTEWRDSNGTHPAGMVLPRSPACQVIVAVETSTVEGTCQGTLELWWKDAAVTSGDVYQVTWQWSAAGIDDSVSGVVRDPSTTRPNGDVCEPLCRSFSVTAMSPQCGKGANPP